MINFTSPFDSMHLALSSALNLDLDYVIWERKDSEGKVLKVYENRPTLAEVEVILFNQLWNSTARGYETIIAGQAMTNAYTVIVKHLDLYCVYFGGAQLAYKIRLTDLSDMGKKIFLTDLDSRKMKSQVDAKQYYV